MHISFYILLVACGLWVLKQVLQRKRRPAPLPPGPRGLPIVGNLADLPPPGSQEWQHWLKHKDRYGPISSLTVLGQTLVILNDAQYANDLLEKRSAQYSARARMIFGGEMVGWENTLVLMPHPNRLRAYRKNMRTFLGTQSAVSRLNSHQQSEVGHFLLRLHSTPADFLEHIRKAAAGLILKTAYGYTIESDKADPLVNLVDEAMEQFSQAVQAGTWLVDIFPFLRYLPDSFPGTQFKRTARHMRQTLVNMAERPYAFVRQRMLKGEYEPSYLSKLLETSGLNPNPEDEFVAKWSAVSMYAGTDTTVVAIAVFFLTMVLFPEAQQKGQEEIDRVIGKDRLPDFADRENLPYVNAIVQEVLRWHPVGPLAVAHVATEDDTYEGYFIPKGTLVIPNVWQFAHDPDLYHDPMAFKPERYFGVNGYEPERDPSFTFGYGRRVCPGRILADSFVFLTIAQTLSTFRLSKAVENGKEVDPLVQFLPGVISHPAPFKITITPRSPDHEALIRSVEKLHPWQESDSKFLNSVKN